MAKSCLICGAPSGIYPLCKKHLMLKNQGKVIKDKDGNWIEVSEEPKPEKEVVVKEEVKSKESKNTECVICHKDSSGNPLCKKCYFETKSQEDQVDRNRPAFELKDHYFNLKSATYRIVSFDNVLKNCKMLVSIANVVQSSHDDTSLTSRVINDIDEIVKSKQKKEVKSTSYTEQSDSQKSAIMRTLDGHIVKSYGEVEVDDILYNNHICHCYEKEVDEISSAERCLKSDWFIPVVGNKGIYIEYWGMNTPEYLKNKEEKRKLYKENNVPLIEVEKDDVKDKTGLQTRILREYKKLKEEIKKSI